MSDYAGQAHEETVRRPHEVELYRIDPVQAGKISGLLHAAVGLLSVPFFLVTGMMGAIAQQQNAAGALVGGAAVVMAIVVPALYGVMGFLIGMASALLYNFAAGWIGGCRIELR